MEGGRREIFTREKGGRGGRRFSPRKGERSKSLQSWVENTNITDYITSP
jgi:hypothetical protein